MKERRCIEHATIVLLVHWTSTEDIVANCAAYDPRILAYVRNLQRVLVCKSTCMHAETYALVNCELPNAKRGRERDALN